MPAVPSTTLPSTDLKHVTLYKNDLAFIERTAKCSDGQKLAATMQSDDAARLPAGCAECEPRVFLLNNTILIRRSVRLPN